MDKWKTVLFSLPRKNASRPESFRSLSETDENEITAQENS